MSKNKQPLRSKLDKYIEDFPNQSLSTDGKILYCDVCEKSISGERRFLISQHVFTAKHKSNISKKNDAKASVSQTYIFSKDLCHAMLSADIPLSRLNNSMYKQFIEKYSSKRIPEESILIQYVSEFYEDCLESIRDYIQDGPIWVAIEETTKVKSCIGNVVIGRMSEDGPGKSFLLACEELKICNHLSTAKLFNDAMNVLWPKGVKYERVFVLITDSDTYMVKAVDALKVLYPKMIHITCLARGMNRLTECIRFENQKVDSLVSNVNNIFCKAPNRISKFKEMYPDVPLPPEPVSPRWGSWLTAVEYYTQHFTEIQTVIYELEDETASILNANQLLEDETLRNDFVDITSNYCFLPQQIKALANPTTLNDKLKIIKAIERKISEAEGHIAEVVKQKLNDVLERNKGFDTLKIINSLVCGKLDGHIDVPYSLVEICKFKYAPVTLCDVETLFSGYKELLNRKGFDFDDLKKHLIIYCNNNNKIEEE